ncbi:MAG: tetratricopeptide repeat protein [Acidimicrobiales bacterium]
MIATVGGPVDPADHIGHESELEAVLASTQSVGGLLTGDRRMGKTSLLRKVEGLLSDHAVLRISAETDDVDLFGRRFLEILRGHRAFADELSNWRLSVDVGYRGVRLKRQSPERSGDEELVDDHFVWAATRAAPAKLIVIIDEITVLATAIERQRPGGATEFLRNLRRPRQELPNVVNLLSGSVGLHHVVRDPAPINDLRKVRIGPLEPTDAVFLARCLLLGEDVETTDELAVADAMAEQTDGIPYFLHHLAAEAHRRGGRLTPDGVRTLRDDALRDPDDPWNVRHYRERLAGYYGDDRDLAERTLDAYAQASGSLDVDELSSMLSAVELDRRPDRPALVKLVESLEADHYLTRRASGDEFSSPDPPRCLAGHATRVMAVSRRASLRPFTPSREAPEALVDRTVGREDLLASIQRRLHIAAISRTRSHTLLVGPRGSGKTHVIDVALHGVRSETRLVIARVDEDAVGIVTYADLALQLLQALEPTAASTRDVATIEKAIIEKLDGRVLVAVIENLARVFESLGTSGQRDFRSFVENTGQVVVLASTPLLFRAIGSRDEPWFGSFAIEHLEELTLDEGSELIRRLAQQDGDERFVEFLHTPKGRARLAALHHLAGGSPRLWMILTSCATVDLLDDLVPAVEELLEKLVTYYQQRLWELPGNEQKLVRELGTGPPSASVGELAEACGLDERTAATALGRLADAGWVRREKLPGTDQRRSWYRLREPLLRHHFQYRQTDGEPLRLIVDILRIWFDAEERHAQLSSVSPASVAERHVLAALRLDPPRRSDNAYAERDVDRLLAEARCWMSDPQAIGTPDAGILIEAAVRALRGSAEEVQRVLEVRQASASVRQRGKELGEMARSMPADQPIEDRIGDVLDTLAAASSGTPDHRVLELAAACWNGHHQATRAVQRLEALGDLDRTDRLTLTIRDERGFWLGRAGRHDEALAALAAVVKDRSRVLGPDHPDTLAARHSWAFQLGVLGRHDEALAEYAAVVDYRSRVLGPDHPDTLASRHNRAFVLGQLSRHDEALAAYAALVEDRSRVLGPDDPDALTSRNVWAFQLSQLGRHDEALAAFAALVEDRSRVLGPDHPDTNMTRRQVAFGLARQDQWSDAVELAVSAVDNTGRGITRSSRFDEGTEFLVRRLLQGLRQGRRLPSADRLGSLPEHRIWAVLQDMEAARDGSSEAAARLPSELRELVHSWSKDLG